jgi:UDP-N-acetylmuramoyl-L-alanyl-D-glutamate--2,6-diaminopimelate ligase
MGAAVGRLADLAVVTSDNPRSEDPMAIIGAVLLGLAETPAESLVEPDRRRAIELALERARPGDVVLLAGKGHEREQEIAGRRLPFDDAAVARELLS